MLGSVEAILIAQWAQWSSDCKIWITIQYAYWKVRTAEHVELGAVLCICESM